jgi:hypothetical protein
MTVLSDVRKRNFLLLGIMIKYFFSNLLITSSDHDIYDAVFCLVISGRIMTMFSFVSRACTGKTAPVLKAKPIRYTAADPSLRNIACIHTYTHTYLLWCEVKQFNDALLMVWCHVAMLVMICF